MIDLQHVRHLLAVASHSTVQAAADALHLTQPALTKSIARFEEELDAKLFDRRGRRLVLTELGERSQSGPLGNAQANSEPAGTLRLTDQVKNVGA